MKKLVLIILTSFLFFTFSLKLNAKDVFQEGYEEVTEVKSTTITGNVTINNQRVRTIHNGVGDVWNNHTINYAIGNYSNGVKTVVHSSNYEHGWSALTTKQAMKQWEKSHPGWICIAGVNGDGFDINDTKQPYHYFMQDGDLQRPCGDAVIFGWTDDNTFIDGSPEVSSNMYIRKYDEARANITEEIMVDAVNTSSPSSDGVTVYTTGNRLPVDLTGYFIYKGKYDITRVAFEPNMAFVKGKIIDTLEGKKDMDPEIDEFYLVSKTKSELDKISIGDYVKCEYKLLGKYADATQVVGAPKPLLNMTEPIHQGINCTFSGVTHPRTVIGIRDNGDVILLTVDGRGRSEDYLTGATLFECEQIMKKLGCTKAFNMDGGGSTTLVARNILGEFEVINTPSDGRERACGNHILFVMKDPGFKLTTIEATHKDALVKVEITDEEQFKNVSNLQLQIKDKIYQYNDEPIRISNLTEKTSYEVIATYDFKDEDRSYASRLNTSFTTTDIPYPKDVISVTDIDGTSLRIVNNKNPYVKNLVVKIDGEAFNLDNEDSILITNLSLNKVYYIEYSYTYDDLNGIIRERVEEPILVKTNSFDKPYDLHIKEIAKASDFIKIKYSFIDPDRVISQAFIVCNDQVLKELPLELGENSGIIKLENINFKTSDNTFKLVIYYNDDNNKTITLESNLLIYNKEEVEEVVKEKGCKKKCTSSLITLFMSITLLGYLLKKK